MTKHRLTLENITKKRVDFGQEIECQETKFEDVDLSVNGFGAILDDEKTMLVVQNGQIFRLDLSKIDEDGHRIENEFRPSHEYTNSNKTNVNSV
ncbi:MAG: hypothetical protein QXE84_02050 [Candidatus Nitrosotenuis sp.]|nr:hypothetical protein [Candidatus Nitrosotenuis uzonensis]